MHVHVNLFKQYKSVNPVTVTPNFVNTIPGTNTVNKRMFLDLLFMSDNLPTSEFS